MNLSGMESPGDCLCNNAGQPGRGFNFLSLPGLHYKSGYSSCLSFFPVIIKKIGEFLLREAVYQSGSCVFSPDIHPHIKRLVLQETKPPATHIQLQRRQPQVKQQAVDSFNPKFLQAFSDLGKIPMDKADTALIGGQPLFCPGQRIRIPVKTYYLTVRPARFKNLLSVSS